jgi:hypothetical protein
MLFGYATHLVLHVSCFLFDLVVCGGDKRRDARSFMHRIASHRTAVHLYWYSALLGSSRSTESYRTVSAGRTGPSQVL